MKNHLLYCLGLTLFLGLNESVAQVGIGTTSPDASSMLDVTSLTQGLLLPRMTIAERNVIASPATGLLVYCTDNNHFYVNKGTTTSPNWVMTSTQWLQTGGGLDTWYSAGKVGIGTTPLYFFDVAGDINFSGTLRKNGTPVVTGVSSVTATTPLVSSGGANPDISIPQASSSVAGYLSPANWSTFNGKQNALTFGNVTSGDMTITGGTGAVVGSGLGLTINKGTLSEATSSVLTIGGGSGSVLGAGTTIQVKQANNSQSGYLSSADWNTFNNKQNLLLFGDLTSSGVDIAITNGTGAVKGSGTSLSINKGSLTSGDMIIAGGTNAVLGGGTNLTIRKGALTESTSSVLTITNGGNAVLGTAGTAIQVKQASSSQSGYLSNTDWTTFNNKLDAGGFGNLTSGDITVTGGASAVRGTGTSMVINKGNLTEATSSVLTITGGLNAVLGTTGTTIQVKQASGAQSGYLSSADWTTFNSNVSPWVKVGANIHYQLGFVGIGLPPPMTNLHVAENNADIIPALLIEQKGAGDAALEFRQGNNSVSSGIHATDNNAFKICSSASLVGPAYNTADQLFRIQTSQANKGITDINHQSRMRAYMQNPALIPFAMWQTLLFGMISYDEHNEYFAPTGRFTAKQEGYYQVNARTEFILNEPMGLMANGYVSIAIYKNGMIYAQGNNLQVVDQSGNTLMNNNAPNVGDVVYLMAGETIEIKVWQNYSQQPATIVPNWEKTYVSIHKVS